MQEFPQSLDVVFCSPPIPLCETSKESVSDWVKIKVENIMTYDWARKEGQGHLTEGKRGFFQGVSKNLFDVRLNIAR